MCSCSGSCNCNSTTIPRGPAGPQGPSGSIAVGEVTSLPFGSEPTVTNSGTTSSAIFDFGIPEGEQGNPGGDGNNGINAYSELTVGFSQPADNNTRTINVLNNTWMAPGQIIYIGPGDTSTDPGGYYKVNFLIGGSSTQLNVTKLDWVDPNTTFVIPTGLVDQGALVTSAGVIGPENTNLTEIRNASGPGIDVPAGSYDVVSINTIANQICTSNGDLAKFIFVAQTFSSSPPAGPDKPYFEFEINSTVASLRTGTLSVDEMVLDVTSNPSYATIEITLKRLSSTSAVCFIKAFLDNAGSSKGIVSYLGDTTVNPITIDFNSTNNFKLTVTLPQTMRYSLISSWIEKYS